MTVLVLAGLLAACGSSKPSTVDPPSTTPAGTPPKFEVVVDDDGLTFPPGKTLAGMYLVSLEDRRTLPPAGQKLHLQFLPSGPRILLFDVPAGTASPHKLLANMTPEVVWLDPGATPVAGEFLRPDDLAKRHSIGDVPVTNPLDIEATPEFPTPVT